jgi:transcriptional regulator with XRE-family HTH domain
MAEKFISNYRLGKELNVHASTVANWRNGKQMPQISHLGKIASFFDCKVEDLVGGDSE